MIAYMLLYIIKNIYIIRSFQINIWVLSSCSLFHQSLSNHLFSIKELLKTTIWYHSIILAYSCATYFASQNFLLPLFYQAVGTIQLLQFLLQWVQLNSKYLEKKKLKEKQTFKSTRESIEHFSYKVGDNLLFSESASSQ